MGVTVTYTDVNGLQHPAIIADPKTGNGIVDLFVFVSGDAGFRSDQLAVNYSLTPTNSCWSFIQ